MNVGVIGTGFGRRVVAPAFDSTRGCRVVDVVSARDNAAIGALVARPDVDLVSVHSPPFLHAAHAHLALRAGKAVLCDKPFACDPAEAEALLGAAQDAGVVHLVNFEFRYHPARRRMRELIRSGAIGRVEHVTWTHLSAGSRVPLRRFGWLFDRDLGGGWIGAWGSHAIDTLRFCVGEVVAAAGSPRIDVQARPDGQGVVHECTAEDGLTAELTLEGGATVSIDSSFAATVNVPPRLTVLGSDGGLEVVADSRITLRSANGAREDVPLELPEGAERHEGPMQIWAEVVRDTVHSRITPDGAPTFADGYACDVVLARLRKVSE